MGARLGRFLGDWGSWTVGPLVAASLGYDAVSVAFRDVLANPSVYYLETGGSRRGLTRG